MVSWACGASALKPFYFSVILVLWAHDPLDIQTDFQKPKFPFTTCPFNCKSHIANLNKLNLCSTKLFNQTTCRHCNLIKDKFICIWLLIASITINEIFSTISLISRKIVDEKIFFHIFFLQFNSYANQHLKLKCIFNRIGKNLIMEQSIVERK